MRLLIADDDLTTRTILTALSSKWGYEPVVVEDGEAAWKILQEDEAPRLLLIDWDMPKLSGLALCQRIRQQQNDDPAFIILLTAHRETEYIVSGLAAGANDYILKPFENAELQARLQVGKRVLDLQEDLHKARNILASERAIIEDIIIQMRESKRFDALNLRRLQIPVEKTSGDILLSAFRPDKAQHILLGDFTGHGLTAALGSPAISDIFYSMTAKGLAMHLIANEINQHMYEKLPTDLFLAAVFIEVEPDRQQLRVWNCGMQNVLIFRDQTPQQKISSTNLALGIIDHEIDPATPIKVAANDHLYAYSDGITEATSSTDEEFGVQRLEQAIKKLLTTGAEIETITKTVQQFRAGKQTDDITLVEVTC